MRYSEPILYVIEYRFSPMVNPMDIWRPNDNLVYHDKEAAEKEAERRRVKYYLTTYRVVAYGRKKRKRRKS